MDEKKGLQYSPVRDDVGSGGNLHADGARNSVFGLKVETKSQTEQHRRDYCQP
jgi:hypothetical protein